MDNNTTSITVTSEDVKSLAGAAEAMNASASSIARSMEAVQKSVESLEATISALGEDAEEAAESADYDRRLREEAEQMYARAVAADQGPGGDGRGEAMAALGEIRTLMDAFMETRPDTEADAEAAARIIGDTLTSSGVERDMGLLSRLDTSIEIFGEIRDQLGTVRTWADSVQQVQIPSPDTPGSDGETEQEVPVEQDSLENDALSAVSEQYSALATALESVGERLDALRQAGEPVPVEQVVPVAAETRGDYDDVAGTLVDSMGGIADDLAAMRESVDGVSGSVDAIGEQVGDIVRTGEDREPVPEQRISVEIQEREPEHIADEEAGQVTRAAEDIAGQVGTLESIVERTETVERERSETVVERDRQPDWAQPIDYTEQIGRITEMLGEPASFLGDGLDGVREAIDARMGAMDASMRDIVTALDERGDEVPETGEPVSPLDSTVAYGSTRDSAVISEEPAVVQVAMGMPGVPDDIMRGDTGSGLVGDRAGNVAPVYDEWQLREVNDDVSAEPVRVPDRGYPDAEGAGRVDSLSPNGDMDDGMTGQVAPIGSEEDRYGSRDGNPLAIEEQTGRTVGESGAGDYIQQLVQREVVYAERRDGKWEVPPETPEERSAAIEKSTAAGVVKGLLDDKVRAMFMRGIAEIVRETVTNIVG